MLFGHGSWNTFHADTNQVFKASGGQYALITEIDGDLNLADINDDYVLDLNDSRDFVQDQHLYHQDLGLIDILSVISDFCIP